MAEQVRTPEATRSSARLFEDPSIDERLGPEFFARLLRYMGGAG
jgi:hypothetical protein